MTSELPTLKAGLVQFLDDIPFDVIASQVADKTNKTESEIATLLSIYANESLVTLDLVTDHIESAERILEVGAGLCLLSLFLKHKSYPVIALEPALGGYGIFEQTRDTILNHFSSLELEVITEPAQQLNNSTHGCFDLIFSNNVIEHIPDWQSALTALTTVLSSEGKMLHSCPNYTIPYEPHYGVPVFRHFRKLSQTLFLPKTADTDIWNSLNFITCFSIKKLCKQNAFSCNFKQGLLFEAFRRIQVDPVFKERHQGIIVHVASLMMKPPFRQLIQNLPACFSTPMIFEITRLPSAEEN
jgi:2-polyprenyl-3-methyl-5-hydroxy-6-metoxy-1,4-benzoquinol methylase